MEATSDDELVKAVFKGRVTLSEVMQPGRVSEIRGAILQWGDIGRGKWRALDTTREQANTGLTRHGLLSEFSTTCISLKGTFRAQIAAKDWPEHASANNFDNLQVRNASQVAQLLRLLLFFLHQPARATTCIKACLHQGLFALRCILKICKYSARM